MRRPPIVLDMTRWSMRRLLGRRPTGIDRVCDAYARHFSAEENSIIQFGGRPLLLSGPALATLLDADAASTGAFRRAFASMLPQAALASRAAIPPPGAIYLNTGHSSFDRQAHWRSPALCQTRRVYMIHDLIPVTHPHLTTARKKARHEQRVATALLRADGLVTNSSGSMDELQRFASACGLTVPPLLRAHLGASAVAGSGTTVSSERPFFLSVGTFEARKNHGLLLRVWSRLFAVLGEETPRLVIAGSAGAELPRLREYLDANARLKPFVQLRCGLTDEEIANLLSAARGCLFPTLAEGFGLPLVEALQIGTPVIASSLPSLHEVGQSVPEYIDPADEDAWTAAILDFCAKRFSYRRQVAAMAGFRPATWSTHFALLEEWLAALPAQRNAGHTNSQAQGISEHLPPRLQAARTAHAAAR